MKSQDLQKLVLSKYENGDGPTKIFRDLNGAISLQTIERWCKSIRDTGCINLSTSPGRPRTIRTKAAIRKIKNRVERRRSVSSRKIARELGISRTSIRRIFKNDLELQAYKIQKEPLLTDEHKEKRIKFANWMRTNFRKEDTMNILFSDEKMFDIDGVYNSQNDRIWAPNRSEADINGGIRQKRKFPHKLWFGLEYIKEVLPIALKFGNDTFGNDWTFQQDGAKPHTHAKSQEWCAEHFPSFIGANDWPPNSPDLNPLDYCIWNEFAQLINWDAVTSKRTLIPALKRAVRKISQDVVFESCSSWTNRLYRLSQNRGNYLR
ncbi:unnamed protein product [Rotaria socialis]|uniref:Transposase Tc1-like domain-containing protein n=2 Tax=Rotaria socialis TaxID=392032 RepID=A0A821H3F6_9BILA|nr:unnamed protein product [Rotaria socialis]